jgi:hypothetical protein
MPTFIKQSTTLNKNASIMNATKRLLNFINENTIQRYVFYVFDNNLVFDTNVFNELCPIMHLLCYGSYNKDTMFNIFTKSFILFANDRNMCVGLHETLYRISDEYRNSCKSHNELPRENVIFNNLFCETYPNITNFDEFAFHSYLTVANIRYYLFHVFATHPTIVGNDLKNIHKMWEDYTEKRWKYYPLEDSSMTFFEYVANYIRIHGYTIYKYFNMFEYVNATHNAQNSFSRFIPYQEHCNEFEKRKYIVIFFHEQTYEQFTGTDMDKIFADIYITKYIYGFL